ncbi:kinase-like protein [Hypoxylon cercidicola]|nr:kinase-like protein [Hypoxylon cercidicola]
MKSYATRLSVASSSLGSFYSSRRPTLVPPVDIQGIALLYPRLNYPHASTFKMKALARWIRRPLKKNLSINTAVPPAEPVRERFQLGKTVCGDSGQTYTIEEVLLDRKEGSRFVYRAGSQKKSYVLKYSTTGYFEYSRKLMMETLKSVPHIRPLVDTKASLEMLIYPYLNAHLLDFAQRKLSLAARRRIVKETLEGLAGMHDRDVIHTDIKPNNILINYQENGEDEPIITAVEIGDMEEAVDISAGDGIIDVMCGNQLWRSPESWAKGLQGKPSDVYSFGVFSIYVVLELMILKIPPEHLNSPDAWRYFISNHISFFGDTMGLRGLLFYLGVENSFTENIVEIVGTFNASNLRKPFSRWRFDDERLDDFKDLVCKMTNLDPTKRITAREALSHSWFSKEL